VSRIKQKFFIACLGLALAVALFTGVFAVMGWGSLLSDVGSAVIYPFQWVGSKIGGGVSGFFSYFADIRDLRDEVESLKNENQELRDQLVDAEIMADENAWLYHYLTMKEERGDWSLCAASVIASATASGEGGDYATELTLNRGSASGIAAGMPVVTGSGLVGVVVEVGLNHCRVMTLLDTSVSVGAVTTRATENGLCEGDYARLHEGHATLKNLPEEADVEVGDIVVTSGRGSVYPYGIPIGRVTEVTANAFVRTTEAAVQPFTDFSDLTQVMIITKYIHYVDGYENTRGEGS
jgi:rod shape-determining protein MreC